MSPTLDELKKALTDGRSRVVNVLPAAVFAAAHIPGSISLPLDDLPKRFAEVLPDRAQPIIAYCGGPT